MVFEPVGGGASVNGKPPVSKTGTAGSTPAAPVFSSSPAGGEGSHDFLPWTSARRTGAPTFHGSGGWPTGASRRRAKAPTPAAPVVSSSPAGSDGVMVNPLAGLTRFGTFLVAVREELSHVSWPTRDELVGSALVVLVGGVGLAGCISGSDCMLCNAARCLWR